MEQPVQQTEPLIFPAKDFDPINPIQGAIYDDAKFAEAQAAKEGAPAAPTNDNTATDNADKGAGTPPAPISGEPAATNTPPAVDYDSLVKEKSNGAFEKWDDLMNRATRDSKLTETSRKILDSLIDGKEDEVAMVLAQRRILAGAENMDAAAAIKLQMRIDDPEATEDDIEDDFLAKYGAAPNKDVLTDPEEFDRAQRKYDRTLKRDGASAKEALVKLRGEIGFDGFSQPKGITQEDLNQTTAEYGKQIETGVSEALKTFGALDFAFEDKDNGISFKHQHQLTENDKAEIANNTKDYFKFFEDRYNPNGGGIDGQKLASDMAFLLNRDKIIKSAAMNAYNQGVAITASKIANVNVTSQPTPAIDFAADERKKKIESFIDA